MTIDPEGAAGPLLVLSGLGHPAVRATHAKTMEFTPADSLGAGGTCIVAVSSVVSGGPAAGVVDLELAVGSFRCAFTALANPDWDPAGPAVIRMSDVRRADTLATHSTLGAGDLPGELRAALADESAEVTLTMTRRHELALRVVLVSGTPSAAERAAADVVVTSTDHADKVMPPDQGRVLVLGEAIPGRLITSAVQPIEVLGLTPDRAVATISSTVPLPGDASAIADVALRESALLMRVSVNELPRMIRAAQRHGRRTGAVLGRLPWVYWGRLEDVVTPAGSRNVWVCLDPAGPTAPDDVLLARIADLRADGMTTKALARHVAVEFGVPVNRVYALAVGATTRSRPPVGEV